jgi:hypothetical protein
VRSALVALKIASPEENLFSIPPRFSSKKGCPPASAPVSARSREFFIELSFLRVRIGGVSWPPVFVLMRALSYILIALGLYLLGHAAYDESCGSTRMPVRLLRKHFNSGYLYSIPVLKANNPNSFASL